MQCASCHTTNEPHAKYCLACGRSTTEASSWIPATPCPTPPPPYSTSPTAPPPFGTDSRDIEPSHTFRNILLCVGAFLLVGTIATSMSSSTGSTTPSPSASVPSPETDPKDAKALFSRFEISAETLCDVKADSYLRRAAKFDYKWDETGWGEAKFSHYLGKVDSPGVIVLVSDKAKLQNGFGAFRRVRMYCHYDTKADAVLRYTIDE
jgi:hypothetical protein